MRAADLFNAFEKLDAELLYAAHAEPQRKQYVLRRAVIAASLVSFIALCGLVYGLFIAPTSYLYLDSRESYTVILNARGRVLSVETDAMNCPEISGKRCEEAAQLLIASMCECGSLSSADNTLIIGVDNLSPADCDRLTASAAAAAEEQHISPAIVTVICRHDENKDQRMTPSVEKLITLLCDADSTMSNTSLSRLSVNDLNLLLADSRITDADITATGCASEVSQIGCDAAVAKALALSGLSEADISGIHTSYSAYHGQLIYLIRLTCGSTSEVYFINAKDGRTENVFKTPHAEIESVIENDLLTSESTQSPEKETAPLSPEPSALQPDSVKPTAEIPSLSTPAGETPNTTDEDPAVDIDLTMKEFSFVLLTPPDSAATLSYDTLFEGQYFDTQSVEMPGTGAVSLITSRAAMQTFWAAHPYPYADADGSGLPSTLDEAYFSDHAVIAVSGVFTDASYCSVMTALSADGSVLYLEASIRYGQSHSSSYTCHTLSLYGIDRSLLPPDPLLNVY